MEQMLGVEDKNTGTRMRPVRCTINGSLFGRCLSSSWRGRHTFLFIAGIGVSTIAKKIIAQNNLKIYQNIKLLISIGEHRQHIVILDILNQICL
jgi:hypothetical protein